MIPHGNKGYVPGSTLMLCDLMYPSGCAIERTLDDKFSITTENGKICTIRAGNIPFGAGFQTRI